jgi:hypothetical protein
LLSRAGSRVLPSHTWGNQMTERRESQEFITGLELQAAKQRLEAILEELK